MSHAPRGIARFDSAAAMVQALAACLHGKPFSNPGQSAFVERAAPIVNALPGAMLGIAYPGGGAAEAIGPRSATRLDIERIASWLCGLYPARPYSTAFIGASNGALVHLAAALDAPWLPQTVLCPVRAPNSDPDDVERALTEGRGALDALVAADARIAVHQAHDPNHERHALKSMRYFRLKHRRLPLAWREFLLANLKPGATLYVDVCTLQWPVTHLGPRAMFQFGALGGATRSEYFRGGPRVRRLFEQHGVSLHHWEPPRPNGHAPEAEWGFDMALLDELRTLSAEAGWRLVELRFEEPEALSFLTYDVYRDWYRAAGIASKRLIIDSFVLTDPHTTLRLHALPFWLLLGTEPSAQVLKQLLERDRPYDAIDLMLFAHGADGIGVPPAAHWQALIESASASAHLSSAEADRFPRDFATFARFHRALEKRGPMFERPAPLSVDAFDRALRHHARTHGVDVSTHTQAEETT